MLLRGLGRLHVFPGDDVGAQKRLARWFRRSRPLDYAGVGRAVERSAPYAGLVYFHLLLDGLSKAGALDEIEIDAKGVHHRSQSTVPWLEIAGDRRCQMAHTTTTSAGD